MGPVSAWKRNAGVLRAKLATNKDFPCYHLLSTSASDDGKHDEDKLVGWLQGSSLEPDRKLLEGRCECIAISKCRVPRKKGTMDFFKDLFLPEWGFIQETRDKDEYEFTMSCGWNGAATLPTGEGLGGCGRKGGIVNNLRGETLCWGDATGG